MRIVAGVLRGRPLVAPKGHSTRPTSDRARQAIFNVLEHAAWAPDLEGARVIDLFAGSGAVGLEAISRGAAFCWFVDRAELATAAIRANLASLGLEGRAMVDRRDAVRLGARGAGSAAFEVAFVDPPYGESLGEAALAGLLSGGWLAETAVVVLERGSLDPADTPDAYEPLDERRWGVASVSFLRPKQPRSTEAD